MVHIQEHNLTILKLCPHCTNVENVALSHSMSKSFDEMKPCKLIAV